MFGEFTRKFRIIRQTHQFLERLAETTQFDIQIGIHQQRTEFFLRVYRYKIHQITHIYLTVDIVHPAIVGFLHVLQLIDKEIISPQFRTIHFSFENRTIFLVQQAFHANFPFIDFRAGNPYLLNHPFQLHSGFLRSGNLPAFLADLR